jgi:O-antigen/teichoic acid export membrane protein
VVSVLRKNILWLLVSQGLSWIVSLFLLILAPKKLDAQGFGRWQFVVAYTALFVLIGSLGSYAYLVRQIAQDRTTLGPLVLTSMRLKVVIGLLLSVVALGLAYLLGYRGETLVLIAISCGGMMLQLQNDVLAAGLGSMERLASPAMWMTAQVWVGSLLGALVLLLDGPLWAFVASFAIAWTVPLVANFYTLRPHLHPPPGQHFRHMAWRPIVAGGLPLVLLTVLNTIYGSIDIPILDKISGSEVVGWYGVAYKWVALPIFITTIVGWAFFPRMSALATTSEREFAAWANRGIRLALFATIPASVGMILVADDLLHLIYGHQYDESIALTQILSIHIPLVALTTLLVSALIASNRQNRYLFVAMTAAIFNPILAIVAITITDHRYGNGAIGAAIVTVITEVFITVGAIVMRCPYVLDRHTVSFASRCALAAAAMAGVTLLFTDSGLFVEASVGGATYAVASIALGTVSASRIRAAIADIRNGRKGGPVPETDGSHVMSISGLDQ